MDPAHELSLSTMGLDPYYDTTEKKVIENPLLKYVEVLATSNSSGVDVSTAAMDENQDDNIPTTLTLKVSREQAEALTKMEYEGNIHVTFVARGEKAGNMIFPRFHQLRAVLRCEKDVQKNGIGGRYLIWHSAGSGKTTMAVNLATALTQTGSVVGLIQTELAYPSIQGFLGMRIEENKPNIKNILFDTTGKYDIEQQFQQYPKNKKLFVLSV